MEIPAWLMMMIRVSIALNVLAIGLLASPKDAAYLLSRPVLLVRSLASMYVVMPLVAVAMITFLDLKPAVEIALVALSLSPIPPILPAKIMKSGGSQDYTVGLLAAASILAVFLIPAALELMSRYTSEPLALPPAAVLKLMLITVLAPLAAGIALRALSTGLADRLARPVGIIGSLMLLVSLLPLLPSLFGSMRTLIGDGTLAAFVGFCVAGLVAGHLLAGSQPGRRVVLAFCTAARHPGMAITIALANYPEQKLVPAAVFLYLILNLIISAFYGARMRHPSVPLPAAGEGPAPGRGPGGLKPA